MVNVLAPSSSTAGEEESLEEVFAMLSRMVPPFMVNDAPSVTRIEALSAPRILWFWMVPFSKMSSALEPLSSMTPMLSSSRVDFSITTLPSIVVLP